MIDENITIALIIGVVLSLLFAEKTGIVPAGLVVPGYIALTLTEPAYLTMIFLASFFTYLLVMKVLSNYTILYGRRKFSMMLIVGIAVKLSFDFLLPIDAVQVHGIQEIGIIVPGIIANTIQRQGVMPTVVTTLLISGTTFSLTYVTTMI